MKYASEGQPVLEDNLSDMILHMVPMQSNFRASYYLTVASKYIAERIVVRDFESNLQQASKYIIAHANSETKSLSMVQGLIYEMICHRWFSVSKHQELYFRLLDSRNDSDVSADMNLTIPGDIQIIRFSTLEEIHQVPSKGLTYYWPTSSTFKALDAFIFDGSNNKCYGLLMTANADIGIKTVALKLFMQWLKRVGIPEDKFCLLFVVPSSLESNFQKQSFRTGVDEVDETPECSNQIRQFVARLDPLVEKK